MNSCLYECDITHYRLEPAQHRFGYRVFMWYLDLDELDTLPKILRWVSRNRWNLFSFRDRDHLDAGAATVRDNLQRFLASQGIVLGRGKVFLLTHLRMLGYVFNPVSFYYCWDEQGYPLAVVAEVGNTFKEQKGYLLDASCREGDLFRRRVVKNFYVSPFIDMDAEFDFRIGVPGDRFSIFIDDYKDGRKFFLSSLTGRRVALSDWRLLGYLARFPLMTLGIILSIHWQALRLKLKGLAHWRKADHPELQQAAVPLRSHSREISHV